jgi:hypothetical protein
MRNPSGILFALVTSLLLAACSSGNSGGTPNVDAFSVPTCGDGICSPSEVDTCPVDCGNHAVDAGVPVDAFVVPPDAGSGGPLDCSDPNTLLSCFECVELQMCVGVDASDCETCLGGMGSGSSGSCNDDFVCEPGEDEATCIDCILAGDTACDGGSPDGTCEADESNATCPTDCP